jgi:stage II sporulation protein P
MEGRIILKSIYYLYSSVKELFQNERIKKIILYGFILISATNALADITVRYNLTVGEMVINSVLPRFNDTIDNKLFIKNYFYHLTQVMIGEPITFITQTMPYLKEYAYNAEGELQDIPGYFENSDQEQIFSYTESDFYTPNSPSDKKEAINPDNYKDSYYILKNFISGDAALEINTDFLKRWDFYKLMTKGLSINDKGEGPKILIFHTHAREAYADGKTVVDVGDKLKDIFENEYGIETLHVKKEFYKDDTWNVTGAYEIMEKTIPKILEENPSIEICIDIHRDGVPENVKLVTTLNNKETAKVMFVNGLCMNRNVEGELVQKEELRNPYLDDNLAFSLQTQEKAYEYYPGLMRKIFLREYRYSLHMKPLSLLIEIGAQTNTGEEALNATAPLADIIAKVIEKD